MDGMMTTVGELRKFLEIYAASTLIELSPTGISSMIGVEIVYQIERDRLVLRPAYKNQTFLIPTAQKEN